jgi:septal ring factor EnvC (AmiA/AmiB activator)
VRSSITPEGEIDAKFEALEKRVEDVQETADSTTAKIEEIDKAQNLVIREITNVQSSMHKIEDHIKYFEAPGGSAAEPSKDLSRRE